MRAFFQLLIQAVGGSGGADLAFLVSGCFCNRSRIAAPIQPASKHPRHAKAILTVAESTRCYREMQFQWGKRTANIACEL